MKITVRVNTEHGIRLGAPQVGDIPIAIDAAALTPTQRFVLGDWLDTRENVIYACRLAELTTAGLLAAIDAEVTRLAVAAAEKAAELAKQREVAATLEIGPDTKLSEYSQHGGHSLDDLCAADPSLRERVNTEKQRRLQVAIDAFLALSDAELLALPTDRHDRFREYYPRELNATGLIADRLARKDRTVAAQRQIAEKEAKDAAAAAEAAKSAQRASWVAQHGTESQQERLAAGVLADSEIEEGIAELAFAAVTAPRYELLTRDDVEHTDEYCEENVSFTSEALSTLTDEQWQELKALRAQLPQAQWEIRNHVAQCKMCDGQVERLSAWATISIGEFKFKRDYAV